MDIWIKIHRWLGLTISAFLLIAAVTGCVLCFTKPLDRALNADVFVRVGTGQTIAPLAAVEALRQARPALRVLSFPLNVAGDRNIVVSVDGAPGAPAPGYDQVFLDRGDGHVVGTRASGPGWDRRHLVAGISALHENLLAGDIGRWILGLASLAWLIGALIGVYLTWPRRPPFWKTWRRMWRFSFKSKLARMMLDLHRSSGLWLLIGIIPLALTSVCLSFYAEGFSPLVARIAPEPPSRFDGPPPFPKGDAAPKPALAEAVARAEAYAARSGETWRPATLVYRPAWNIYGVTFTADGTLNYRGYGPPYYYVDADTGAPAAIVDPYRGATGLKLNRVLYPIHSGQGGGSIGVAIIFLLGLASIEMIVTGVYVWWKRRKSRVAAKRAAARRRALA